MNGSIWGILGVAPGSDRDTVRRAYARKLRVTNPEDDPQGFMALREAYEAALDQLRWAEADARYDAEADENATGTATDRDISGTFPPITADFTRDSGPDSRAFPPETAPSPELAAFQTLRAADEADLLARQQALVAALDAPWAPDADALFTLFNAVLAAPLLAEIAVRAGVEQWMASIIANNIPRADPLVRPAVDHFGWEQQASHGRSHAIYAVLQRLEEGLFAAEAARPHAPLHLGWQSLTTPPLADWRMRLGALLPGRPAEAAAILATIDNGLPGVRDWLNPQAEQWWRDYGARARVTAGNLLLAPLALAVLALFLIALDAPPATLIAAALAALAAPFAAVRLVKQPQRDWADAPWDHPDWHFTGWIGALAALPVIAFAVPATPVGVALLALAALPALAWTTIALPLRADIKPWERIGGIIRTAWPFGILFSLGAEQLGAIGIALWSMMTLALVIGWWRGGDTITEAVGRRIPRFALPILVVLVSVFMIAIGVLTDDLAPRDAVLPVYLALSPAAILLYVANRLVPEGRIKLLLAVGWLMVFLALFAALGRAAPRKPDAPPAVAAPALAANGIGDTAPGVTPATPRTPVDGWINVDDYAPAAFARPGFYTQTLGLDIDSGGRVTACRTLRASANAVIDGASCAAVTGRARLNPARGSDGTPVASTFTMQIVWAVPAGVKPSPTAVPALRSIAPPAPSLAVPLKPLSPVTEWVRFADYPAGAMADDRDYAIGFELEVAANGRASACRITAGSGSAVVDRTTCAAARRRARFTPARDARGEPVASRYAARLSWSVVPAPRPVPAMPASPPLAADRTAPDATLAAPPILSTGDSGLKPD